MKREKKENKKKKKLDIYTFFFARNFSFNRHVFFELDSIIINNLFFLIENRVKFYWNIFFSNLDQSLTLLSRKRNKHAFMSICRRSSVFFHHFRRIFNFSIIFANVSRVRQRLSKSRESFLSNVTRV